MSERARSPITILEHAAEYIGYEGQPVCDRLQVQHVLLRLAARIRADRARERKHAEVHEHLKGCAKCREWAKTL